MEECGGGLGVVGRTRLTGVIFFHLAEQDLRLAETVRFRAGQESESA